MLPGRAHSPSSTRWPRMSSGWGMPETAADPPARPVWPRHAAYMTTDATRSRSAAPSMSTEELTRLATLYFIDGQTQDELSRRLGISRATVGRMIKRAQDLGIVEIRVRHHPTLT